MAARQDARVWLALGTVYLVWGSTFIALAIVVRDLPPLMAMSARHLVAGGVLLAFALPRGDRGRDPIGRAQVGAALVFGGLLFLVAHGSLAWAQQTVPAGIAALLVGTIPIWIVLLDRVFLGRRLHASAYAGLVLGFVGLGFLFDPFGEGSVDRLGALVVVLGALSWAAGSERRSRCRWRRPARRSSSRSLWSYARAGRPSSPAVASCAGAGPPAGRSTPPPSDRRPAA